MFFSNRFICAYSQASTSNNRTKPPKSRLTFFRKTYSFKIFRATTKLKKYSKFITLFPKKFYIRRKRRTSNYNLVPLFIRWLQSVLLEKRVFRFIQGLSLHATTIVASNFSFLIRQLRKADINFSLNTHYLPQTSFYSQSPLSAQLLCGVVPSTNIPLLVTNGIWIDKYVGGALKNGFCPLQTPPHPSFSILSLIFKYITSHYLCPLYQIQVLMLYSSYLSKK